MRVLFESFIIGCFAAMVMAWLATFLTVAYHCIKKYPQAFGVVVALWVGCLALGYGIRELLI